jgi:hypothetical protein
MGLDRRPVSRGDPLAGRVTAVRLPYLTGRGLDAAFTKLGRHDLVCVD